MLQTVISFVPCLITSLSITSLSYCLARMKPYEVHHHKGL